MSSHAQEQPFGKMGQEIAYVMLTARGVAEEKAKALIEEKSMRENGGHSVYFKEKKANSVARQVEGVKFERPLSSLTGYGYSKEAHGGLFRSQEAYEAFLAHQ